MIQKMGAPNDSNRVSEPIFVTHLLWVKEEKTGIIMLEKDKTLDTNYLVKIINTSFHHIFNMAS